jgi:hypothetical protein
MTGERYLHVAGILFEHGLPLCRVFVFLNYIKVFAFSRGYNLDRIYLIVFSVKSIMQLKSLVIVDQDKIPVRYFFRLFALNQDINLAGRGTRSQLMGAMDDKIIDEAILVGKYARG